MKTKSSAVDSHPGDILDLILDDHKDLKRLLKILKDPETDIGDRYAAFEEFGPLLVMHAKPEEQTLYVDMKKNQDMRIDGMEGEVEHSIAENLLKDAQKTKDEDLWSAKVKVLAELVDHHIKEEEEDMFPQYKKKSDKKTRQELGEKYMQLKSKMGKVDPMFGGDGIHQSAAAY